MRSRKNAPKSARKPTPRSLQVSRHFPRVSGAGPRASARDRWDHVVPPTRQGLRAPTSIRPGKEQSKQPLPPRSWKPEPCAQTSRGGLPPPPRCPQCLPGAHQSPQSLSLLVCHQQGLRASGESSQDGEGRGPGRPPCRENLRPVCWPPSEFPHCRAPRGPPTLLTVPPCFLRPDTRSWIN